MKNRLNRLVHLALATGLVFAVVATAAAEKEKPKIVTIKSGPRPTSGNEPGTGKDVLSNVHVKRAPAGPGTPPDLELTFTLQLEASNEKGLAVRFQLKGQARPAPGGTVDFQLRPLRNGGGVALFVDSKMVDQVRSPHLSNLRRAAVTITSTPFDQNKHPYGMWTLEHVGGNGAAGEHRTEPPVVLVPYPTPVPIPFPKPPTGG